MSETVSSIISTSRPTRAQPALYVGLAGDDPRAPPARFSLADLDRVDVGRGPERSAIRRVADGSRLLVLSLADTRLSTQHARVTRLGSTWFVEDLRSKNGTLIAGRRTTRHQLRDGEALVVGHTVLVFREQGGEAGDLEGAPRGLAAGLGTFSGPLAEQFENLAAAAATLVPIEITGASGTGKEIAARAVHELSRRTGRFAAVNCGALSQTLLEAELFGHKKGAFTGAAEDRPGVIRSAEGGTLFLDEIAELPIASQAALLRVLQEGELVPVGADRPVKVDVRIVTATHKQLDVEVSAQRFRSDLRARLLGVQLALLPLRERREDLGHLITTLLDRIAPGRAIAFSADAVAALYSYDWPLNIRELERALAAALAIAKERVELQHLPAALRLSPSTEIDVMSLTTEERLLRESLIAAIERHDGNLAAVARDLGKDRTQIRRWMKRFGLTRDDD